MSIRIEQKFPKISVIIPVFNGEKFLARIIHSVQQQNYSPLEIIVVDDGSTDSTADILRTFDSEIQVIVQENQGPAAARNAGMQHASGEIYTFLDVDDEWASDTLKSMIQFLLDDPAAEIVQGLIQEENIDWSQSQPIEKMVDAKLNFSRQIVYRFVNLGSSIYRKSVFERVGLLDESLMYGEDTDWFTRAWEHRVRKLEVEKIFLRYRKHGGNMTCDLDRVQRSIASTCHRHLKRRREQGEAIPLPLGFPSIRDYGAFIEKSVKPIP